MTIQEAVTAVQLIMDEKSLKTADRNRIITFLDMGQCEIAVVVPIRRSVVIQVENPGAGYPLPANLYRLSRVLRQGAAVDNYIVDTDGIHLPSKGSYVVEYKAHPAPFAANTPPDTKLEIEQQAQTALVYYAAAQYCLGGDDDKYAAYFAQYQGRLRNLEDRPTASVQGGVYVGI